MDLLPASFCSGRYSGTVARASPRTDALDDRALDGALRAAPRRHHRLHAIPLRLRVQRLHMHAPTSRSRPRHPSGARMTSRRISQAEGGSVAYSMGSESPSHSDTLKTAFAPLSECVSRALETQVRLGCALSDSLRGDNAAWFRDLSRQMSSGTRSKSEEDLREVYEVSTPAE